MADWHAFTDMSIRFASAYVALMDSVHVEEAVLRELKRMRGRKKSCRQAALVRPSPEEEMATEVHRMVENANKPCT